MTQQRDIERLLDQWFGDGPAQAPDRVVDIVTERIERQPQRPAWRLDWRHLSMSPLAKAGAAIAAVVLIALVGYNLLPGASTGVGGPASSASPTSSPTASPTVIPAATPSPSQGARPMTDGLLAAGTYTMKPFTGTAADVTASLTVPDGWHGAADFGALIGPTDRDAPTGSSIVLMQANGAFDDPCHWDKAGTGSTDQPGEKVVGPTVNDLVDDIRANKSYTSTTPVDVTIDGYLGKRVDLQLPSDLDFASCDKEGRDSAGNYFVLMPPAGVYAQGPGNRWHLRIIDVDGSRLIVAVMDYELTPSDIQAEARAIIDSIKISK